MKGIIVAGGTCSRLHPMTAAASKQLLPVYDKPLIYYPLSTLMLSGIRDILIVVDPGDKQAFERLLGDGTQWGISLSYATQAQPNGIAEALVIGKDFYAGSKVALILGDNIFFGHRMSAVLDEASRQEAGATIFGYWVPNPDQFGIVELAPDGKPLHIEEKPAMPRSHYAVTGLYFYDEHVTAIAERLSPSARGELEITDVNRQYLEAGNLSFVRLERGFAWLDAGTNEALLDAANYIATIERRQGLKIACVEEIAWRQGWIDDGGLQRLAALMPECSYRQYLNETLKQ